MLFSADFCRATLAWHDIGIQNGQPAGTADYAFG
jgi:hypothetical protein